MGTAFYLLVSCSNRLTKQNPFNSNLFAFKSCQRKYICTKQPHMLKYILCWNVLIPPIYSMFCCVCIMYRNKIASLCFRFLHCPSFSFVFIRFLSFSISFFHFLSSSFILFRFPLFSMLFGAISLRTFGGYPFWHTFGDLLSPSAKKVSKWRSLGIDFCDFWELCWTS